MMSPEHVSRSVAGLSAELVAYLGREGIEVAAPAGEVLVRRGEPGIAFWTLLDGTAEVRLAGEDGLQLPLARLGAGSTFGEMALLTGEPVSADVVALTDVRLLRYPGARFAAALGESGALRALVLSRLSANLRGTNAEVWNFFQQARALNVLIDPRREAAELVAESAPMKTVRELIAGRGRDAEPLLVCGDPGTGKGFVAAKVHEAAGGGSAPLIAVDCRTLEPAEAMRFICGSADGFDCGAAGGRPALRRYGALHLAHGGTLVLRHADELPRPVQAACGCYLAARRSGKLSYPAARLALTSDRAPADFLAAVEPALAAAIAGTPPIVVPRLHERRRDLLPLARLFLAQRPPRASRSLSRDAEHALLSQRYAHRNAAELREAIELAAVIADEPVVRAEHIFTGPKGEGTVQEIDLGRSPLVQRLIAPRAVAAARAAVFLTFLAIIAASLLRGDTRAGAAANALTWGLWEPALFVAFLLLGRVWCTVCPLSTAGRLAARVRNLGVAPGAWLKDHSGWCITAGFVAVIWSEHAFRMTERPRAAALLLLALFAAAMLSAVIWRRESWCRYLCPLGNLGAVYSLPAMLTVRSNPSVCATMCSTHECFKGSPAQPGCPVFHHPLYANEAHACKLCLSCLRVCPHGSARLFLRLPLQSVWAQPDVGRSLVPFALFMVFFSPAMLASQREGSWAATLPGFSALALAAVAATAVLAPRLPRLLAAGPDPEPAVSTRVAFTLLVLAWGPAMAFQLAHVGALASLRLHAEPGSALARTLPAAGLQLVTLSQMLAVAAAGLAAGICLLGIRGRLRRDQEPYSRAGWRLLAVLCAAYGAGSLALAALR